ncbi:MAG: TetR/AcrR family transcriptional regulator [Ardenticatenaceae bacterium]|nr:TetR/AcrR family transcriptional regulator [Ardenticatenaceae bacterium]
MSSQNQNNTLAPILSAARRLLQQREDFTMDDLAAETGLSRATLYRRSGGRDALLKRLAREDGLAVGELSNIRERILLAVRRTIKKAGSFNVTVDQVAAEAGVGVATIYRHFGVKEELLQSFVEELTPRREAREILLRPGPNVAEDLTRFATQTIAFAKEFQDFIGMVFFPDDKTKELLGHLQPNPDRTLSRLKKYFEVQIARGRLRSADPFDLATTFAGMVLGISIVKSQYTNEPIGEPVDLARKIVDTFLNGAASGNGGHS